MKVEEQFYEVNRSSPNVVAYRQNELPVGTVICSFLDWKTFQLAVGGDKEWAPCDGRPVPGSYYSQLVHQEDAPDLRGLFLRGRNSIDPSNNETISKHGLNPDEPPFGISQDQSFLSHTHVLENKSVWTEDLSGGRNDTPV
jgi:hypothetical protein